MDLEIDVNQIFDVVIFWGIRVLVALAIFVIGKWIAGKVSGLIRTGMEKRKTDPVLISFLGSLIYYFLIVVVAIAAIGQLGIQTTSLVAIVGAAGLAVGLALQGSLSNFAAGVLIILFRPFKVGDFVDVAGTTGIVEEIGILTTEMRSPDNKKIIVPNGGVMGGNIINFTAKDTRRCDMVFGISYEDDFEKAKSILVDLLEKHEKVLKDPAWNVRVIEHADSSINICCRPWVKVPDYWDVFFDMQENVKKRFDEEGITIPFPQRDVHLFEQKS